MASKGILWLTLLDHTRTYPVGKIHPNPASHLHVTLQFGVAYTPEIDEMIGKDVQVVATANCYNNKVQALRVELPDDVRGLCKNAHPHMTISMENGVKPVESNNMLAGEHSEDPISIPLTLRFEFFKFDRV